MEETDLSDNKCMAVLTVVEMTGVTWVEGIAALGSISKFEESGLVNYVPKSNDLMISSFS